MFGYIPILVKFDSKWWALYMKAYIEHNSNIIGAKYISNKRSKENGIHIICPIHFSLSFVVLELSK
jgi:hypothetical protein